MAIIIMSNNTNDNNNGSRLLRHPSISCGSGTYGYPSCCPNPLRKHPTCLPKFFPLGVAVRIRTFLMKYIPKALRRTTSAVSLLLGQRPLGTHVVAVFWVVNLAAQEVSRVCAQTSASQLFMLYIHVYIYIYINTYISLSLYIYIYI